jgi:O-methyltransferase
MKSALRFAATRIGERTYERLLAHSVLKENFAADLAAVKTFPKREELWSFALEGIGDVKLVYIEFGVLEGDSIRYFAKRNSNPASVFIGLDSFEGLPEDWGSKPKGTFDVGGAMPKVDDPRVKFIKGWFQNTWDALARSIPPDGQLIVHYDADLYSSTLFALTKIDTLKRPYVAIFDEFAGHEARALRNFQQAYNPSIQFVGKTVGGGYPSRVLCRIDGVPKSPV